MYIRILKIFINLLKKECEHSLSKSKNWKKVLVKPKESFDSLIEKLHLGGIQTVLVVNDDMKLLGMITDGDVRRVLLKKKSSSAIIAEQIMNKSPVIASVLDRDKKIIDLMNDNNILQVPLVDNKKRLIGIRLLQDLIKSKNHTNKVVIMAGGFGKRLHPITKNIPKPMLQINNQPILETILLKISNNGFSNFIFSLYYKSKVIEEYFEDGSKWHVEIEYLKEKKPLGTAGALGLLNKKKLKEPIIINNADIISNINYSTLLDFHNKNKNKVTVCIKEYKNQVPFGVIKLKGTNLDKIIEKPVTNHFVNAGIYIIEPELLINLDGKTFCDMTEFILNIKNQGIAIGTFPIYETWNDIGSKEELKKQTTKKINKLHEER